MNDDSMQYINDNLITTPELAKALKLTPSAIYKYRQDNKHLSMDQLFKVSAYLKNKHEKFDIYLTKKIKAARK